MKQGKVSVLEFLVSASPELDDRGIGQFFTFSVEDSMNFASTPSPSLFYLSANESQNVEVKFSVPLCFPNNAIDSVTITVKSEQTNEVSSFLVDVFVDSEVKDCEGTIILIGDFLFHSSLTKVLLLALSTMLAQSLAALCCLTALVLRLGKRHSQCLILEQGCKK